MPVETKLKRLKVLALVSALVSLLAILAMYGKIRSLKSERDRLNAELERNMRLGAMIVEPKKTAE
jgi:hypothetical protein